jgi:hypothetical protein
MGVEMMEGTLGSAPRFSFRDEGRRATLRRARLRSSMFGQKIPRRRSTAPSLGPPFQTGSSIFWRHEVSGPLPAGVNPPGRAVVQVGVKARVHRTAQFSRTAHATALHSPLAKGEPADQNVCTKQRQRIATCRHRGHPTQAAGQSPRSEFNDAHGVLEER